MSSHTIYLEDGEEMELNALSSPLQNPYNQSLPSLPQSKDNNNNSTNANTWEWNECPFILKQSSGDSEQCMSLRPTLKLQIPGYDLPPQVDIAIELRKPFLHHPDLGWNWHKSWNIPDINCKLSVRDPVTGEELASPQQLQAKFYVVNVKDQDQTDFYLDCLQSATYDFAQNKVRIDGNKFASTSYNNDGRKFNLVVVIQLQSKKLGSSSQILHSFISPSIFVDSRKQARASQKLKNFKKQCPFTSLFDPSVFTRTFYKKEKTQDEEGGVLIENTLEGLFNYLSAPNIRQKVKHPLFLASYFSSCFSIKYNQTRLSTDSHKIIQHMQTCLNRSLKNQNKSVLKHLELVDYPFLIIIQTKDRYKENSQTLIKKIKEYVSPLDIPDEVKLLFDPRKELPHCFKSLPEGYYSQYSALYAQENRQDHEEEGGSTTDDKSKHSQHNNNNNSNTKRITVEEDDQLLEERLQNNVFHTAELTVENRSHYEKQKLLQKMDLQGRREQFLNDFPYLKSKCRKSNNTTHTNSAQVKLQGDSQVVDQNGLEIIFEPKIDTNLHPILVIQAKKIIQNQMVISQLQQQDSLKKKQEDHQHLQKERKTNKKGYQEQKQEVEQMKKQLHMYQQQQPVSQQQQQQPVYQVQQDLMHHQQTLNLLQMHQKQFAKQQSAFKPYNAKYSHLQTINERLNYISVPYI